MAEKHSYTEEMEAEVKGKFSKKGQAIYHRSQIIMITIIT